MDATSGAAEGGMSVGVYINGMEMPTEGEYNMTLYVCSDGSAYMDIASFPVDKDKFEVVPVPPHGRLIDADALIAQMEADAEQMEDTLFEMATYAAISDVKHQPTIIPAEPPKEETK